MHLYKVLKDAMDEFKVLTQNLIAERVSFLSSVREDFRLKQRCNPLQRGKRPNQPDNDTAPEKLVRDIQRDVWRRPTFSACHKLLNNYTRSKLLALAGTAAALYFSLLCTDLSRDHVSFELD